MEMVKHFHSSQISKFAMSLQYFKREIWDKVCFLHANKHQNIFQVDFDTLDINISYNVICFLSFLTGMS